jgi:YD repeat-containing protein
MKYDAASGSCIAELDRTQKSCCNGAVSVGNPILPGTGGKRQLETDYVGSGEFPLTFQRIYSSGSSRGPEWTHTFDRFIAYGKGTAGQLAQVATLRRPEGDFAFTKTGTGAWTPDQDVNFRFSGSSVTTEDGGYTETYNSSNQITSVIQRFGSTIYSMVYSTATTPPAVAPKAGLLLSVSDPFGRSLQFSYDSAGRMAAMADPGGGIHQYAYDPAGNLVSVTYPDGAVRQYVYNEPTLTSGADLPKALTGIIDENGVRYASFGYYADGRAKSTEYAGGAQRYEVTYASAPTFSSVMEYNASGVPLRIVRSHTAPSGTVVTDALGAQRTYGFVSAAGAVRATGSNLPCTGVCTAVPVSQSYDANGNRSSETDFNGVTTNYVFDLARNLETSRTEAVGTAQQRTISRTLDTYLRLPTQIVEPGRTTTYSYNSQGLINSRTVTDTTVSPNVARTWS